MPQDGSVPQVAGWFPAVGLAVGAVGYAFVKVMEVLPTRHIQPLLIAALVLVIWALVTRMLHFDGLADVADGFWGSHDPVRRLEIMSDSYVGAFGASAIALVVVLEVAALGAIIGAPHELPILLVPGLARFAATAGCWFGTPARDGGLGRSVIARPTVLGALPALAVLVAIAGAFWYGFGATGVGLFMVSVVIALSIPHLLARRFGGVTGDVLGASVLLSEALLFAGFVVAGLAR
jgi:adenosylcobinamide-GDP ribazoletransferase